MAVLIHQDSPICVKSELDLFSIPSTQAAIEFGKFVEYFPLSNIRDGSPVEFHISGSGDEYLDFPIGTRILSNTFTTTVNAGIF
ncbi:hypothetical protein AVEN_138199-1 [Araneus ventricosus]|uniref:Uncharacterized protein n=1 Tax=Araneus ventricosus TaxID=182803 RepID=A0A4Y2HLP0_ARAVE|nr:hypothetical protein AVEN_138199-1 [Araneus ventricosus]